MILGIGNDICDIRRIEKTLDRFGERFLAKVFTAEERRRAYAKVNPARTLAKRFAAKEAMSKALGTGFRFSVHLSDIGVVNAPTGRPSIVLTGGAARQHDRRAAGRGIDDADVGQMHAEAEACAERLAHRLLGGEALG